MHHTTKPIGRFALLITTVALAAGVTACGSGDDAQAVTFTIPAAEPGLPVDFEAAGDAVTDDLVCAAGSSTTVRLESMDGDELTNEAWADIFDAAEAEESIAEMNVYEEWACDDGSGTFSTVLHNVFDFATFEFIGQQDVGTWEVTEGTGDYADLSGSGTTTLDLDADQVFFAGEVEA